MSTTARSSAPSLNLQSTYGVMIGDSDVVDRRSADCLMLTREVPASFLYSADEGTVTVTRGQRQTTYSANTSAGRATISLVAPNSRVDLQGGGVAYSAGLKFTLTSNAPLTLTQTSRPQTPQIAGTAPDGSYIVYGGTGAPSMYRAQRWAPTPGTRVDPGAVPPPPRADGGPARQG